MKTQVSFIMLAATYLALLQGNALLWFHGNAFKSCVSHRDIYTFTLHMECHVAFPRPQ